MARSMAMHVQCGSPESHAATERHRKIAIEKITGTMKK
jgi:hypothetical protein